MAPGLVSIGILTAALAAQTPKADGSLQATPAARMEFMKESVRRYEISGSGARGPELKLQEEPAFLLGGQGGDNVMGGAIFLWTGATGRPEAANQVFLIKTEREPEGLWVHEFTSLSPVPLTARRMGVVAWAPRTAGLEFKPVPGAAKPADSPARRQRQMHEIALGFRGSDNFHGKGWSELRVLPKPITRYGGTGTEVIDGALFALVLGTDPEVFVFLEPKGTDSTLEWHYALAPMTVFALKVTYQDKPVWSLPSRDPANDKSRTFYDTTYIP